MSAPELHSLRLGQADRPLLMLHGWGQDLRSLHPMGELLAPTTGVHLVDLPGFGGSPAPPEGWGTGEYADRMASYIQELDLAPADILGHSYGARVAIQLAARHPELVRRLVLISAAGLPRRLTSRQELRRRWIRLVGRWAARLEPVVGSRPLDWYRDRYGSEDYKQAGALRPVLVRAVTEDLTEPARSIRARALLLWGLDDRDTPLEMGHRYRDLIPDSRLLVLPGKGHFPFRDGGEHLCAYHVRAFLAEEEG